MNHILLSGPLAQIQKHQKPLKKKMLSALRFLQLSNVEISIAFVNNRTIQTLNRTYRKKNQPTDVLSFSQKFLSPKGRLWLGDIVISLPIARDQAQKANHSIQKELHCLALHGLLHLLGYDHETQTQTKKMFALQDQLVSL